MEADPEELLWLGSEQNFPPKDGKFEVRITEELREVLYLDSARLVIVDHPQNTVIHPAGKMVPSRPFAPHELWTLCPTATLKHATRSDGLDVTEVLTSTDGNRVAPVKLREPQLRGLAEPFSVTLDFGELPLDKPLVLALNGWLRFGGGMANVAASLNLSRFPPWKRSCLTVPGNQCRSSAAFPPAKAKPSWWTLIKSCHSARAGFG